MWHGNLVEGLENFSHKYFILRKERTPKIIPTSSMKIQHFYGKRMLSLDKKIKIPLSPPTATALDCYPSPSTIAIGHCWSLSNSHWPHFDDFSDHCWSLPSSRQLLFGHYWPWSRYFFEIYTIFSGMPVSTKYKNYKIPGNLICDPHASKRHTQESSSPK